MKTRWKILIAFGILLVLLAASTTVTMHVQPASELESYKKSLVDQGEKLEISELVPPCIPDESNGVPLLETAYGSFAPVGTDDRDLPSAMWMVAPGRAMVVWAQSNLMQTVPNSSASILTNTMTNTWDNAELAYEANEPALDLLWEAASRPACDFQLDYKKGASLPLPQLASEKRAAQLLGGATVLNLHYADSGAATTNILTQLELLHNEVGDDLLISHLVRMAISAIAIGPTWELLQATNVTDENLAAVENGWQQLNFLKDAETTFTVERAFMLMEIEKSRSSHEGYKDTFAGYSGGSGGSLGGSTWGRMLEDATEAPRNAIGEAVWRSSWSYSHERHLLQTDQVILEALRAMQTNRTQFYKADYDVMMTRLGTLGLTNAGEAFFDALKIPDFRDIFGGNNFGGVVVRALRVETARDLAVAAIALKRFQLKHGKYPDKLDDLTPEFLLSVPIDPYDGKPLKYHPNADGAFLLYAVGENGVDDGGDPSTGSSRLSWQDRSARDWVWPQPATPAEVEYYYEHPPK